MITLISSTTRKNSRTIQVTKLYAKLLEAAGVEFQIIDLSTVPHSINETATYEKGQVSDELTALREKMKTYPKMVFILPEYNGSFPGTLKTFIDGMPHPDTFRGKKIGLVGLGSGVQGAVLAMSHLTDIFHYLNADVMGFKPKLNFIHQHLQEGEITNALFNQMLEEHLDRIIAF